MKEKHNIYLDHSATTPVAPEVVEAMVPFFGENFGNASSIHSFGQSAKVALEEARRMVSRYLNAQPSEIVFTSGGTEADNWAIQGAARHFQGQKKHIITSAVEHHAVLNVCKSLTTHGFEVTFLPVDRFGLVSPDDVLSAINENTCLVSIIHGNNEIGSINPVKEIGVITREYGVLFHTDAIQTFGKLPIDVDAMNIDLLSLSAHKIYGPKGVGGLYIRQGIQLQKQFAGGRQERDRRAGTENIPAIVGLSKAVELCSLHSDTENVQMQKLAAFFSGLVAERLDGVHFNGHPELRLPAIVNLSFDGVQSDSLLLSLDLQGIAVSNGSACTSGTVEPSHVVQALGGPRHRADSAIRFSFGRGNVEDDAVYTVEALQEILPRLRKFKRAG